MLQAAGYSVHVASKHDMGHGANQGHLCCGRTYLASGQVSKAKEHAQALLEALLPFAQKGIAIVGLEPSCLLTLRDETLVMSLGEMAGHSGSDALLLNTLGQDLAWLQTVIEKKQPFGAAAHCLCNVAP